MTGGINLLATADFAETGNSTQDVKANTTNGTIFTQYDANNTSILAIVGSDWHTVGPASFGNFSSNAGETDMILRNDTTGEFQYYGIQGVDRQPGPFDNVTKLAQVAESHSLGAVGTDWQQATTLDHSKDGGGADLLLRNTNSGEFEIYNIHDGLVAGFGSLGSVGLDWQMVAAGSSAGTNPAGLNLADNQFLMGRGGQFERYTVGADNSISGESVTLDQIAAKGAASLANAAAAWGGTDSASLSATGATGTEQPQLFANTGGHS